jgi:phage tail tape-measure protein
MKHATKWAALGILAALAACGTNPQERTSGGAAAGAATGAVVGALAGPPGIVVGAVVGGGAGAITGAETKPSQLNLGRPVWDNPNVRVPTPNGPVGPGHPAGSSSAADNSADQLNSRSYQNAQNGTSWQ